MDPADLPVSLAALETFRDVGVNLISLNAGYGEMPFEAHVSMLEAMNRWVADRPQAYLAVRTATDARMAASNGRLGIVFDVEGAATLEGRIERVDRLHELGVRWMLLAYNRANVFAGGCHPGEDIGLTALGRDLIRRMEAAGMVVCLSHVGPETARAALGLAQKPMIFSHSNPASRHAHPRNISDDLARACAGADGVIGVNGLELFLGAPPTVEQLVEHIERLLDLVGPRHVGLGLDHVLDLEGLEREKASMAASFPPGFGYEQPTRCLGPLDIPVLADALYARGHAEGDIAAILGGNWLRIAEACW
jgi:membrane dipeptidase